MAAQSGQSPLRRADLVRDLARLGVPRGGLLFIHSSLRSIGYVEGGAGAVVDALLESLGPQGTLVVPTFTDPAARDPDFVFDPFNTPTYLGAIPEAARRRPGFRRSIDLDLSVAAIGPLAETIVTSGGDDGWDGDSPMGQVNRLNGMLLLLGVPYQNLTAVHVCEVELGVAYRPARLLERRMHRPDGSLVPLRCYVHPPQSPWPGSDFNRLGRRMEDAGLVKVGRVGNAIARLFYGHHLRSMAEELYKSDPNGFLKQGDAVTALAYGHTVELLRGELCVVDPGRIYGARRLGTQSPDF